MKCSKQSQILILTMKVLIELKIKVWSNSLPDRWAKFWTNLEQHLLLSLLPWKQFQWKPISEKIFSHHTFYKWGLVKVRTGYFYGIIHSINGEPIRPDPVIKDKIPVKPSTQAPMVASVDHRLATKITSTRQNFLEKKLNVSIYRRRLSMIEKY